MDKKWQILLATTFIMTIIAIPSGIVIYNWGHDPVHRMDIEGVDPAGDVSDPDVDIIFYKSYKSSEWRQNFSSSPYFIVIEITVVGTIKIDILHMYSFNIVARRPSDEIGHVYGFNFQDGEMSENLDFEVENSTIRMYFPVTRFIPYDYMTGLEVWTSSLAPIDIRDITPEVRDTPIAHRYW